MTRLPIPEPLSGGIFLTYKCNARCKHCMYACSPRWEADWLSEEDAQKILTQLAAGLRGRYPYPGMVSVNHGIHFTGGEPFLNFGLLLGVTRLAHELEIPSTFVETNGFWCQDDETTRDRLVQLAQAGLDGILISANPFVVETVPFERTERAARISQEVFGRNAIVYQGFFFDQFRRLGLKGRLPFEEYLQRAGLSSLHQIELLPMGRVVYRLAHLFRKYPARHFFGGSCQRELIRDWHIHIDNYCNFVPGYCGGLSLGDARDLDSICQGIDLGRLPVLRALLTDLEDLYRLGREWGYEEGDGYISKCHLCLDVRRFLVKRGEFEELRPKEFYERLGD